MTKQVHLFFNIIVISFCILPNHCLFNVPKVTIQALRPKGLRVSIPDQQGIQLFSFHGQKNKPLSKTDLGELSQDVEQPQNNLWLYFDPNVKLEIGDVIYYWYIVYINRLGYRKLDQTYTIKGIGRIKDTIQSSVRKTVSNETFDVDKFPHPNNTQYESTTGPFTGVVESTTSLDCETSKTTINGGKKTCKGDLVFEDNFNTLSSSQWIVEQYIPSINGPDYEFNSYWKDNDIVFINNSVLNIRPKVLTTDEEVRKTINFKHKCTKNTNEECYRQSRGFILPPVKSGKIRSKFSFKYGKIDVKAKLPSGDWIVPVIALYPKTNVDIPKIVIAYARGNKVLTNVNDDDIGSKKLYGGLVEGHREPLRSLKLQSFTSVNSFSDKYHIYSLYWSPGIFKTSVDGLDYSDYTAEIVERNFEDPFDTEFFISFGVAIGGVNDFPDDYHPINYKKPWINSDRNILNNFFKNRTSWLPTWEDDAINLKIDYVKVWAHNN